MTITRLALLEPEIYISVAEKTMQDTGNAGEWITMPEGKWNDPDFQARLAPIQDKVNGWLRQFGETYPFKVYVDNYTLDQYHADAMTDGLNYIKVRRHTNDMILLHECAHILNRTKEGQGHDEQFARTATELYRRFISNKAADMFWELCHYGYE